MTYSRSTVLSKVIARSAGKIRSLPAKRGPQVAARPEVAPHHRTDSSSGAGPGGYPASERSFAFLGMAIFTSAVNLAS